MDDRETIKGKYWQCMIDKDTDGLREIMADDYVLIHMTGMRQDKEAFLEGLLGAPSITTLRITTALM